MGYFKTLRAAGLIGLALARAQTIPPGEIHSRTVAYTPPTGLTLRTEVRVVEVPAVVRDSHLRAVDGFTRDDFEIYDEGKRQAITAFSVEHFTPPGDGAASGAAPENAAAGKAAANTGSRARPRFLAICFDDLHLLPALLNPVKQAAERFVKTGLAPCDRAVIVRTSKSEDAKFTNDVPTLIEQIEKVAAAIRPAADDAEVCPHIDPWDAYRIANRIDPGGRVLRQKRGECVHCFRDLCPEDEVIAKAHAIWPRTRMDTGNSLGVIASLVDGMANLPGQRIVVLTSGGFLTGTLEREVDQLMEKARHAEVVINGLDARGLYQNASAGMAYDGIGVLASGTGGTFFHNNNGMEEGFRVLGMAPETSYVLGFTPAATDGKFHNLKVRLAAKHGDSVEARLGYTAAAKDAAANPALSKFDNEVMAPDAIADLPASFTWEQWAGPPGITMIAHIDIARLHFVTAHGRRVGRLTIVGMLTDGRGNFVAGKRSELELDFTEKTFAQFSKTGLTAAMTIPARAGNYRMRAVAQDSMEGKLATANDAVQVK